MADGRLKKSWMNDQGKVGRVLGGGYDGKARQFNSIPLHSFLLRSGSLVLVWVPGLVSSVRVRSEEGACVCLSGSQCLDMG